MQSEEKLQAFLKSKYNLCIGERTAEDLKLTLQKIDKGRIKVSGRCYKTGRRKTVNPAIKELLNL